MRGVHCIGNLQTSRTASAGASGPRSGAPSMYSSTRYPARRRDLADVRMVQSGDRARFLFEAAQPIGLRDELRRQNLDRDIATQPAVACTIDLAHTSRADRGDHFIRTEARAGRERHGFGFQFTITLIGPERSARASGS